MKKSLLRPLTSMLGMAAMIYSLQACKKVASDDLKDTVPYYQKYTVDYDKDNDKTSAFATFKIRESNGTTVDLNNGASVTANGSSPNGIQLVAGNYNWSLTGIVDVNFVLTKNSGTKINNTVAKTDIGDIAFPSNMPSIISKAAGFSFNWAGPALTSGESLVVTVTGSPLSSNVTANVEKNITGGTVDITSGDLSNFSPGTIFVTLKRSKTLSLDAKDDTAGGEMTVTIKQKKDVVLNN